MTATKKSSLVAPVVVLTVIAFAIAAILAFVNDLTAPVIQAQEEAAAQAALLEVMPDGTDFTDVTGLELPENVVKIQQAGNGAGYVFTTYGKGFGGNIQVMVGIAPEGAITGTKVLIHGESAGISDPVVGDGSEFQQQLPGVTDVSEIEAVSGATKSSNGMIAAIEAAFDALALVNAE